MITEAGFGADMGAERFFNIKCRSLRARPDAAVVVATVRALKAHSGKHKIVAGKPLPDALLAENPDEVHIGGANLRKQIENIRMHGVSPVVAINAFPGDHPSEHAGDPRRSRRRWAPGSRSASTSPTAARGADRAGRGGRRGGRRAVRIPAAVPGRGVAAREDRDGGHARSTAPTGVDYGPPADRQLDTYERNGFGHLPVCIAKTHLSISSDPALKGAPTGWTLPVREVRASVGAGFIYPICGDMRTMPGLGGHPAAYRIDLEADGTIVGLS